MQGEGITYFVFSNKTVFIPLKYLYPECSILLERSAMKQLHCLVKDGCPANRNCMENLVKRVHYFFDKVEPNTECIISYFKEGESIKAGVFDKDLDNPRLITCNQSAFKKFHKQSTTYNWKPSIDFYLLTSTSDLIKPSSLIR